LPAEKNEMREEEEFSGGATMSNGAMLTQIMFTLFSSENNVSFFGPV